MPSKIYFVYFRVFYEFLIFIFALSLEKEKIQEQNDFEYFLRSEIRATWTILSDAINSLTEHYKICFPFYFINICVEYCFSQALLHDEPNNDQVRENFAFFIMYIFISMDVLFS